MNHRRAVSVLFAAAAATMLVTASFGFTGVSADRGVSVAVVESENAYVGVSVCETDRGSDNGSNPVKVTVSNQFSAPFTVTLISGDGKSVEPNPNKAEIEPGDTRMYPNAFGEEQVTVEVVGGLDASVTAEVGEQCTNGISATTHGNGTATPTVTPTPSSNDTATETPTPEPTATPTPTPTPDDA
ncbi:hypothetical protein [Halolamina rubra]|uniref:hypothetical protein n=1 Tax=Halolamina rubra TaxID=1380430 RepID=UPI0006786460|nr:hypothetical protein [Halolamina rubra]